MPLRLDQASELGSTTDSRLVHEAYQLLQENINQKKAQPIKKFVMVGRLAKQVNTKQVCQLV